LSYIILHFYCFNRFHFKWPYYKAAEVIPVSKIISFLKVKEASQIILLKLETGTDYNEAVLLGIYDAWLTLKQQKAINLKTIDILLSNLLPHSIQRAHTTSTNVCHYLHTLLHIKQTIAKVKIPFNQQMHFLLNI